jgi:hypothetical protein
MRYSIVSVTISLTIEIQKGERMHSKMSIRIYGGLKKDFKASCEEKDVSCSEMLRRLILMWIGKESEHDTIKGGM